MNYLQIKPYRKLLVLLYPIAILFLIVIQQSCKKDDECNPPQVDSITYEDSTYQINVLIPSKHITIHGSHLKNTLYIYINRLKYDARYIYHSDSTISFQVPYVSTNGLATSDNPYSDSLMITKECGKEVLNVRIMSAPPYIRKISNEYGMAGDIITLKGRYFDSLLSIAFPSNKTGEIIPGYNDTVCQVIVPQGVINEGQLVFTTPSGNSHSAFALDFWDRTGLLCNFDDVDTYEGSGSNVISGTDDPSIPKASGYFYSCELTNIAPGIGEIESTLLPATILGIPACSGNLSPAYFGIQTEIYLRYPWKCGYYKILLGRKNDAEEMEYSWEYNYQPWSDSINMGELTTVGWETMTIPLTDFRLSGSTSVKLQSFSQLRLINYMQWIFVNPTVEEGGKPLTHFKIALDNIRLVQTIPDPE